MSSCSSRSDGKWAKGWQLKLERFPFSFLLFFLSQSGPYISQLSVSHGLHSKEGGLPCFLCHVSDLVSLWEECHSFEMSAGCQSKRQSLGGKEPCGGGKTNKRGICEWKTSSVILKKLPRWSTRSCVLRPRPFCLLWKDKPLFHYCLVLI